MLVLSRRIGEAVLIDDEIAVEILQCSNGRVKIGIVAPPSRRIVRSEVCQNHDGEDLHHPGSALPHVTAYLDSVEIFNARTAVHV